MRGPIKLAVLSEFASCARFRMQGSRSPDVYEARRDTVNLDSAAEITYHVPRLFASAAGRSKTRTKKHETKKKKKRKREANAYREGLKGLKAKFTRRSRSYL